MRSCLLGVFLFAVSACIPDRDNPHDPALQPDVVLSVSPLEGTRQTPFTLDASASTGPGTLSYCWDLDEDPSDFEVPCGGTASLTSSLTIPAGGLGSFGEGVYEKTVRVVVRAGGAQASGSTTVRIRNTRPALDAGPEIVTAAGQGQTVHLDGCAHPYGNCASFDPDGDAVSWTWRQVDGAPIVLTTNGRLASFTAPLADQVLYFELVGDDGLAVARARTTVRVGTSAWVTSSNPSRVFRIHREIRQVTTPPEVMAAFVAPYPGSTGDLWLAENLQVLRTDADGAPVSRFSFSADYTGRVVPRGTSACIRRDLASGGREVGILRAPVAGLDGTYLPVSIPSVLPSDVQEVLPDPGDPSSCIVAAGTKGAFRIGLDGEQTTFIAPGSPQVYFSEDSLLTLDRAFWSAGFVVANGVPRFSITRVGADGSRVTHESTTSGGVVEKLFALDDTTVLVVGRTPDGSGRYAFRANAGAFEPIEVPPLPLDSFTHFASLPDGSIFAWTEAEQTLRRLRVRGEALEVTGIVGSEELSPTGLTGLPLPDVWNGGVAMSTQDGVVRISGALRKVEQVATVATLTLSPSVSSESSTGSLWIASQGPGGGIDRVDASGRTVATLAGIVSPYFLMPATAAHPDGSVSIVRFPDALGPVQIETYDRAGGLVSEFDAYPEVQGFDLDAGGDVACAWDTTFGTGRVWSVDDGALTEIATGLIAPIGVATAGGDCWFYSSGTNLLHYDDGSGLQTFDPGTLLLPSMRTDPRDGTLWIADGNVTALRHYSKAGVFLTSIAGGDVFDIEEKCASGAGCVEFWTAEGTEIVRRNDAGVEIERIALPLPASSLVETVSVSP